MKGSLSLLFAACVVMIMSASIPAHSQDWTPTPSSADHPPRKVIVGTVMRNFKGDLATRLHLAEESIDRMIADAAKKYPGERMDLLILPEHAICQGETNGAEARAVPLEGDVLERLGGKAKANHTYVVVPMLLKEKNADTNVAVLLNREGKVAGIYRKVHPVVQPLPPTHQAAKLTLENGITAGDDFPVFNCDFGKVGAQICWDGCYEDGWRELAKHGAEIVVYPSASPANVRQASYALRGRYYVLTSTPRDNVTLFSPIGLPLARVTGEAGSAVLTQKIDLSYVRLAWSPLLKDGQIFNQQFGDKAGYFYSPQEDTGVFWSNDPKMSIGEMIRQLGLVELEKQLQISTDLKSPKAK